MAAKVLFKKDLPLAYVSNLQDVSRDRERGISDSTMSLATQVLSPTMLSNSNGHFFRPLAHVPVPGTGNAVLHYPQHHHPNVHTRSLSPVGDHSPGYPPIEPARRPGSQNQILPPPFQAPGVGPLLPGRWMPMPPSALLTPTASGAPSPIGSASTSTASPVMRRQMMHTSVSQERLLQYPTSAGAFATQAVSGFAYDPSSGSGFTSPLRGPCITPRVPSLASRAMPHSTLPQQNAHPQAVRHAAVTPPVPFSYGAQGHEVPAEPVTAGQRSQTPSSAQPSENARAAMAFPAPRVVPAEEISPGSSASQVFDPAERIRQRAYQARHFGRTPSAPALLRNHAGAEGFSGPRTLQPQEKDARVPLCR
eukprot:TRINITY_DN79134_c0_g1_i1.p1 TRINITY_DN79134_c0_g1~~TRINITY_DN79134_c0_g1_i1.p1  ORF type:complete len:399 (-),score=56.65 TRINITY_DN79134_c0_g1_i1:213-1304(-)